LSYGHYIKPASLVRTDTASAEIITGTANQLLALGIGDAPGAIAVLARPTKSHFDEYQQLTIAHDEIDLSHAATKVPVQTDQPLLYQKSFRGAFRGLANGNPVNCLR